MLLLETTRSAVMMATMVMAAVVSYLGKVWSSREAVRMKLVVV